MCGVIGGWVGIDRVRDSFFYFYLPGQIRDRTSEEGAVVMQGQKKLWKKCMALGRFVLTCARVYLCACICTNLCV